MGIDQVDVQAHFFVGGVYLKQVLIPEGHHVVTHKHQYDHASVLGSGCAIVICDDEQKTYYAPDVIEIKAGVAHEVIAVNGPVSWFCIHSLYNIQDQTLWHPDKIDVELIEQSITPS